MPTPPTEGSSVKVKEFSQLSGFGYRQRSLASALEREDTVKSMLPLRLFLVTLVILIHECKLSSANKYDNNIDDHQDPRIQPSPGAVPGQEFKRYVVNDPNYHYHEYKTVNKYTDVPPPSAATRMARYVVHNTAWGALATISQQPRIKTFPFVNTFSVSDGPLNNGTGIPYLYLTPLDMSAQDLNQDYRSSLTMTLAETNYCDQNGFDPEDPRCAKVIFTGKIKRVISKIS
uniref:CREG-like beta-barrel domain-containing protein n=1 Tax=Timema poppense TaxID=170557 RepID=A0A7R9H8N8_TIMPO|nr:unnamed protein product [Timema poppensis]